MATICTLSSCISAPPTDTPKTRVEPKMAIVKPPKGQGTAMNKVNLVKVEVSRLKPGDPLAKSVMSPETLKRADDFVLIEVKVNKPFDPRPRTSSPVIILNGSTLVDSIVDDDRLRVVVDRRQLKETNTVTAAWLGNERDTISQEPLTFKLSDIAE